VVPVSGAVKVEQEAPVGAFLVLHRVGTGPEVSAEVPQSRAVVKQDGSFTVSTYEEGDGAPPGEYVVTAVWNRIVTEGSDVKAGPNVISEEYGRPETSPWKVTVTKDATKLGATELPKAGARAGRRGKAVARGGKASTPVQAGGYD
jgi:hypothetical protein